MRNNKFPDLRLFLAFFFILMLIASLKLEANLSSNSDSIARMTRNNYYQRTQTKPLHQKEETKNNDSVWHSFRK